VLIMDIIKRSEREKSMDSKEIREIKTECETLIRFGNNHNQIQKRLEAQYKSVSSEVLADIIEDCVADYKNYGLIQKLVRSDLVCDQLGEDNTVSILDKVSRQVSKIHRSRLVELFDRRCNIKNKIITCEYEYRPYDYGMLIKNDDDTYSFNTYQPPFWFQDCFFSEGNLEVPKELEFQNLYRRFFMHLVNKDKTSYNYLIQWLANGLRSRNYCILATIGKQGIGKGVLGGIMRELFGASNFYSGGDRMFKGTFNSQIANKRLVYCDEISIKNKEEEDRIKLVVNDYLEIEQKGVDAKEIKNYANFYISSNNMDSISLTADDRRFSIIELTDKKLTTVFTPEEIQSLFAPENIKSLASFLWHYHVDEKEMLKVFVSKRTEEVRSSSLKEWEDWFIFRFCEINSGKNYEIWEAADQVKEQFGYSFRIGRGKFLELMKKYPEVFSVKNTTEDGVRVWRLHIHEKKTKGKK